MEDCVILALQPRFASAIVSGEKTIELRRRFTKRPVRSFLLYESRARMAIVARGRVDEVINLPLVELWNVAQGTAAAARDDFNNYFKGLDTGFALRLSAIESLVIPITIQQMRSRFHIAAPQSYSFAPPRLAKYCFEAYSDSKDVA